MLMIFLEIKTNPKFVMQYVHLKFKKGGGVTIYTFWNFSICVGYDTINGTAIQEGTSKLLYHKFKWFFWCVQATCTVDMPIYWTRKIESRWCKQSIVMSYLKHRQSRCNYHFHLLDWIRHRKYIDSDFKHKKLCN